MLIMATGGAGGRFGIDGQAMLEFFLRPRLGAMPGGGFVHEPQRRGGAFGGDAELVDVVFAAVLAGNAANGAAGGEGGVFLKDELEEVKEKHGCPHDSAAEVISVAIVTVEGSEPHPLGKAWSK
jgi:hypothetical protein